jgi:stage V sporulation protein R
MDEAFIERSAMFVSERGRGGEGSRIGSRDHRRVKEELLRSLSWAGQPRIELMEVASGGRRDLVLRHHHDGRDLKLDEAAAVLKTIEELWRAPVQLLTQEGDQERRLTAHGGEVEIREVTAPASALPSRAG